MKNRPDSERRDVLIRNASETYSRTAVNTVIPAYWCRLRQPVITIEEVLAEKAAPTREEFSARFCGWRQDIGRRAVVTPRAIQEATVRSYLGGARDHGRPTVTDVDAVRRRLQLVELLSQVLVGALQLTVLRPLHPTTHLLQNDVDALVVTPGGRSVNYDITGGQEW